MPTIKVSTITSKKGNSFLVLDNGRFHPAGASTWLTVEDLQAIMANESKVAAFLEEHKPKPAPMVTVMPPPPPVVETPPMPATVVMPEPEPVPVAVTPPTPPPVPVAAPTPPPAPKPALTKASADLVAKFTKRFASLK